MSLQIASGGERIVGYYPSWNRYTTPAAQIPFQELTHLCHAFIWPQSDGSLEMYNDLLDPALNAAARAAGVRMIISAGGWGQSAGFAPMAANDVSRSAFIANVIAFMVAHDYQGLDLDWEYPENSTQRSHFTRLMRELRTAFDQIDSSWSLSFVVPSGAHSASRFEFAALIALVDWVGCMTYDMHGEWTPHAGHNAPLYAPPDEPEGSIDLSVKYLLQQGWPEKQVLIGVPFYGRLFNASRLYGAATGGTAVAYKDIIPLTRNWTYHWDDLAQVPYYQDAAQGQWLTFDDTVSVRKKAAYVREHGLGGVIIWAIGQDNLGTNQPLLQALGKAMRSAASGLDRIETDTAPSSGAVIHCCPNPCNESTHVHFYLATGGTVHWRLLSITGQVVQEFPDAVYEPGWHQWPLLATGLSSGVYLLQMACEEQVHSVKVTLVR